MYWRQFDVKGAVAFSSSSDKSSLVHSATSSFFARVSKWLIVQTVLHICWC